ncbi:hypothetical protein PG987_003407 [Apiospora arundinis]
MRLITLLIASISFTTGCAMPVEEESLSLNTASCKRQSDSDGDGGDLEGELLELVDIVLEITEEALGANYSGSGSGTFVGGNFLSPTIVIDPNYQNGH